MSRAALQPNEIAATRKRLCSAALSLYQQGGEAAVTFRRLADQMGTSHTRPYRYFDNKEALMAALRVTCFGRFMGVIRSHDDPGADPATRLRTIFYALVDYLQQHPAEYQLMFCAGQPPLARYPDILRARQAAFDYLVAIVKQAVDAGLVDADPRTLVHVGWSGVHGLLSLHTAGQLVHGRCLDELIEPLFRTTMAPLFAGDDAIASARPRMTTTTGAA